MSWRKSGYSHSLANCVEVNSWRTAAYCETTTCVEAGSGPGVVAVRDTADRDGVVLEVSPQAWARLTSALR